MTFVQDAQLELRHDEHRQLYDYWRSKRQGDRLPSRADINPADLRFLLPRLALIDVLREHDNLTFRHRLTGTEIVARSGRDPTGKRFEELYRGEYLQTALATYREVVETGRPNTSDRVYPLLPGRDYMRYDRLLLPLAADGVTVDMVMTLIVMLEHRRTDPNWLR
ncbi:PAS domain-containing protein [Rhodovibrio salinarum]|nr:PAS domain-containing protein [Rhodovibrio salinarum]